MIFSCSHIVFSVSLVVLATLDFNSQFVLIVLIFSSLDSNVFESRSLVIQLMTDYLEIVNSTPCRQRRGVDPPVAIRRGEGVR